MQTLIYHGKVDMIYCQIKYNKWRVKLDGDMGTPEWSSSHEHPNAQIHTEQSEDWLSRSYTSEE